ncbi:hypothetical protein BGW36DRAFT_323183 [Talaromyces proteolyticus]|uniref:XPG-I domain-containing protein n=1 Tax=Talaromyces proteolyticus TaxID=1131652 RepID=A0AAD4KNH5_9EURO|nr:uncharacterized protein BGW36DRAFT_323183 [Talaromyces proteolyticus]KAH8695439.1 hypothetical protein BGW36DRAFT_323183 [Talaromyces proteolyticus]
MSVVLAILAFNLFCGLLSCIRFFFGLHRDVLGLEMGIPGLNKAIGNSDRIALSRLAVKHLEATRRPIKIAVDISIWLFQLQAGRGGQNPELRTLFFRLVRLLALPVHPLFVYDGMQKPPFKRGKATTGRSYGSTPIISQSKILIDLFKFPRHDAPGEAEAECARLQQAGVVDAVMSNDIDTLMFGSTLTVMNFSKENSTGTSAATHVDCYTTKDVLEIGANVKLSRAGMVLFALLSGGDYLPSGVTKCGPSLAGEIAKAGFGEDLFEIVYSEESKLNEKLGEWRERLQYELDENESGYFQSKHKAVRIPESFPDHKILSFYARPIVSNEFEIENLRQRLIGAWDHDINVLELRRFVADFFDWKYRSGARKLVRNLAEPLVISRLRLARSPIAPEGYGNYVPNQDLPVMQRVYRTRMPFVAGGLLQLQMEMVPLDVVGLDLDAEEPNPPPENSQLTQPESQTTDVADEEDDGGGADVEPTVNTAVGVQLPKKIYDPSEPEKIWVFEAVAKIGLPDVVERWKKQDEEKKAPKKPAPRKTAATRKKKVIDPSMKPGGILRYTTVTKPGRDMDAEKEARLFQASTLSSSQKQSSSQGSFRSSPQTPSKSTTFLSQSSFRTPKMMKMPSSGVSSLAYQLQATSISADGTRFIQRRSPRLATGYPILGSAESPIRLDSDDDVDTYEMSPLSKFTMSYTPAGSPALRSANIPKYLESPVSAKLSRRAHNIHSPSIHTEDFEYSLTLSSPTPSQKHNGRNRQTKGPNISIPQVEVDRAESPENNVSDSPRLSHPKPPMYSSITNKTSHESKTVSRRQREKQQHKTLESPEDPSATLVSVPSSDSDKNKKAEKSLESQTTKIETIRIQEGFWSVEVQEMGPKDVLETNNPTKKETKDNVQKPIKKRIGRVSLLDMS